MSLMNAHRLRAPSEDGALLAVPPLSAARAVADHNRVELGRWDHDFQGRRASRLRPMARRQALDAAAGYLARHGLDLPAGIDPAAPLIVTGHQPELFHPGVWVKNFAIAGMAAALGGTGLNLVVDNDLPKSCSIRVPQELNGALRVQRIDYSADVGDAPFEDLDVSDEGQFASFGSRVREALAPEVADPLINEFWPRVLARRTETRRIGLRFALARRTLEADWGVRNAEIPLSTLCETEAFLWFASHVLAHLPRFQEVHNQALTRYRARYHIRSRHHPVPALTLQDGWHEAPFWIWRAGEPRRRPLFVRQHAQRMELRAGGDDQPCLEIPLGPDREACCAVERLLSLPAQGIRLRTRALTTTMFARLLLGDVFAHGIGGAKYDELGDELIQGFFGIDPPDYLTLSMTLWLGLGSRDASPAQLDALARHLRDLTFNPDRHLPAALAPETRAWVQAKQQAIAAPTDSHEERLARFRAIRRCNDALQPAVAAARTTLLPQHATMLDGMKWNARARSREYAFVLHSERRLRGVMRGVMTETSAG